MIGEIILDQMTRVAPLGLSFWDPVTGSFIADGLQVTAIPKSTPAYPGKPVAAFANRSGIFVFHHLPGLAEAERGAGDQAYWTGLPAPKEFIITVTDLQQRFLPFKFVTNAPQRRESAWSYPNGGVIPKVDQPLAPGVFPLFSTPSRNVPQGMGNIRASLRMDGKPAAWAMVEAYSQDDWDDLDVASLVARGIADLDGQVTLIFPYPKFINIGTGGNTLPLTAQRWLIHLKIFFSPQTSYPKIPDRSVIAGQAETDIQNLAPSDADIPASKAALKYGVELIFRTKTVSELQIKAKP